MERFSHKDVPQSEKREARPEESVLRTSADERERRLSELARASEEAGPSLSRRGFLLGSFAFAGAAALDWHGKHSPLSKWLDDTIGEGQYGYDAAVREARSYMKERYGIELFMGQEPGQDEETGNTVRLERYRNIIRALIEEMVHYPPEMVRKAGEHSPIRIRIIDSLHVKGPIAAMPDNTGVRLGGLVTVEGHGTRFSLDAALTDESLHRNVHHEMNHVFSRAFEEQRSRDQHWTRMHQKLTNAPYCPVGPNVHAHTPPRSPYFLTEYASSAAVEDEAVCAEWMMTPRLMVEFLDRWRNEKNPRVKEILGAKFSETQRNYFTWSGGLIGKAFWEDIIKQGEWVKHKQEERLELTLRPGKA